MSIRDELSKKVIGQSEAVRKISEYVDIYQGGLSLPDRPAGVFMLQGPTGVGKTYIVEALASVLHRNHHTMIRIDCEEFQHDHEISKLMGAPPGYIGYRESNGKGTTGRLAPEKLLECTSEGCKLVLILFDEIEKGAPTLFRILLQIMDKGTMTGGDNITTNFENTMIFMTSNLGAADIAKIKSGPSYGFQKASVRDINQAATKALKKNFTPEFINRLDEIILFESLLPEEIKQIFYVEFDRLRWHVAKRKDGGVYLKLTGPAEQHLIEKGFDAEYGARHLKRLLMRKILAPLSRQLIAGELKPKSELIVDFDGADLVFRTGRDPDSLEVLLEISIAGIKEKKKDK